MASEGPGQDDELGVRLDWPGDDTGFVRRPDAPDSVEPSAPVDAVYVSAEEPDADAPPPVSSSSLPLLPALLGKLDNVDTTVTTLGMRVDALGATTTSFHSAFFDRLTEYVDTVAQITRSQQETLEEYRHGNDRSVAELRRTVGETDEVLRRMSARLDEIGADVASLGDVDRSSGAPAAPAAGARLSEELGVELAGLREDIVQLKRRLGVRAKAPAVLEETQIGELVDRIAGLVGPPTFADEDIERVALAVVKQLEQFLEVVPEPASPAARTPPAPTPSPRKPPPAKTPPPPKKPPAVKAADGSPAHKKKAAGSATTSRRRRS
jgi:hypothetical protein